MEDGAELGQGSEVGAQLAPTAHPLQACFLLLVLKLISAGIFGEVIAPIDVIEPEIVLEIISGDAGPDLVHHRVKVFGIGKALFVDDRMRPCC